MHTHISPFCLLPFLGLCIFLSSSFPPLYPTPSSLCLCVSTCTSSLLSHLTPFEVWDSSKSNVVLFWTAKGKWLRKKGSSSITAVNQKSTLPSMAWCEKWFWFQSVKATICYMHRLIWRCIVHLHTLPLCAELEKWKLSRTQNTHPWRYARDDNETENRTNPCSSYCIFSGSVQFIHHTEIIWSCKPWIMFCCSIVEQSLSTFFSKPLCVECNVIIVYLKSFI